MSDIRNDSVFTNGRFPLWGPYSKKYMGISHIAPSKRAGVRFDLTTVPAIANMDIHLPNVTLPTGWRAIASTGDYSQYTYRVDLEWKDVVYGDVSYTRLSDHAILIRTELVNHSQLPQNLMINYFASIEYPQTEYTDIVRPEKSVIMDALDYESYTYASPRPWDRQNPDGHKKGEIVDGSFTEGHGLGDRSDKWHLPCLPFGTFGSEKGDAVSYRFELEQALEDAVLTIRYRSANIQYEPDRTMEHSVHFVPAQEKSVFLINGTEVRFPVSDSLTTLRVPLGALDAGEHFLDLVSEGHGGLELDFLAISESKDCVETRHVAPMVHPELTEELTQDGAHVSLTYPDVNAMYHLYTTDAETRFRHIETGSLEDGMSSRLSNPDVTFDDVLAPFTRSFSRKHSDDGFFHNTLVHTIFISPGQTQIKYALLCDEPYQMPSEKECEALYQASRPLPVRLNQEGEPYRFSTDLLKAAVLTNIVFPIYKAGTYIPHHTPGKRWDSLYTWDSGFIGLGMMDLNPDYAEYILDTYTCEPGYPDYAFLHHGSPVPVQMYLFYELLQKAHDKQYLLEHYYPRLKYYYEFLAGRGSGSTTARFSSGLTSTYDYFYSSSGMDDYPPQAAMIEEGLQRSASPVISTSQVIRSAKILQQAAQALGLSEDVDRYQQDIDRLTAALNQYAWDPEAGYFSYVLHDENGRPIDIYRTQDGENLNKGLDGIYPLIAGILNEEQKEKILHHLTDPGEMLSPYGISAVDQSAGYFKVNGYWNGNVWFPHQWFIWKTMLDLNETDFAHTIAMLALNVWKKEVDATHYTFEMVSVVTGRGGWFHNFGGLSAPIELWANAYFRPGTINTGFDTWIENYEWSDDFSDLSLQVKVSGSHASSSILVVMNEGASYEVRIDGSACTFRERYPGMLEIQVPSSGGTHTVTVHRK